jgi:hypothetical protein
MDSDKKQGFLIKNSRDTEGKYRGCFLSKPLKILRSPFLLRNQQFLIRCAVNGFSTNDVIA